MPMRIRKMKKAEFDPNAPENSGKGIIMSGDRVYVIDEKPTAKGRYLIDEGINELGNYEKIELVLE
jgi:hypothetical protein